MIRPIIVERPETGNLPWRVAFRHLLPNSVGPLLAFTSINAAFSALVTASLGFLGLGLGPNVPEWGNMIARGQDGVMTGQWWVSRHRWTSMPAWQMPRSRGSSSGWKEAGCHRGSWSISTCAAFAQ